jgi:DNA polymerase III epsilon subunit-like protein
MTRENPITLQLAGKMKFNNDLIVFDLETTMCEQRHIIEIGAVYVDKECACKDVFDVLVSNPLAEITPELTEITTLTKEQLDAEGKPIGEALQMFEAWVLQFAANTKKPRLAAWGNYFDMPVLRNEYKRLGREFPFSGTCIDIKSLAFLWCGLSGRRTDKMSVQTVYENYMGNEGNGRQYHRANVDAVATAAIYQQITYDLSTGMFLPDGKRLRLTLETK